MPGVSRRQGKITTEHGLHLRAANQLVQLAMKIQSDVQVFCNVRVANGKSFLDLIALGAECSALLEFEVIGPDSEEAAAALSGIVESCFHDHEDCPDHAPEP